MDEARGNRAGGQEGGWKVGRMVEEEEEVEEEERGVSGQPGSSRATRRNPLSHPPSPLPPPRPPGRLSSRRPCQPSSFSSYPLPPPALASSSSSSSFSTSYPNLCPLLYLCLLLFTRRGWLVVTHPAKLSRTHCEHGASPSPSASAGSYSCPRLIAGFHSLPLLHRFNRPPFRRWSAPIYFELIARLSLVIDSRLFSIAVAF